MSTIEAHTKTKQLVPELRFPEYDGEWSLTKVIDFAPLQRGFDLPVSQIEDGPYPVVFSNGALKTHSEFKAKAPGVVTGRSGTIGKVTYVEEDYWPHNTALWVTNFFNNDPKYVFYFYINIKLERFGTGSGVPTLNRNDVHAQKRAIPSLTEQQKIASFLSSVDEKIQQLSRKKELLEQYKKGVMQRIFSQEIRFKDENGNDFPDWKDTTLEACVSKFATGLNPRKNFELGVGDFNYVTIKNICKGKLDFNSCENIDGTAKAMINNRSCLKKGDIIMASIGNIGDAYLLKEDPIDWDINESVFKIEANQKFINRNFLFQILTGDLAQRYFEGSITGSSFKSIKMRELKLLPIRLPTILEQEKIADLLTQIDERIYSTQDDLNGQLEFKKGLLQKMFV